MKYNQFSWGLFLKAPIIGIVRNLSFDELIAILPVYVKSGLTTIEITMNTPGAEDMIGYASKHYPDQLNIGAGTVCTKGNLKIALNAGASFIVTPIISKKVIQSCVKKQVPIFPGAYTPSELYKAWSLGASMVKVFPATILGVEYIKDIKGPLNQIKLMPTGGVDLENIAAFFKAGADGAGIGSHLLDKALIKEKNWKGLETHFKKFVNEVKRLEPYV
jgi:2-dehydro-3-deoxyphosphogluconate aldolase/(4S)-4-hydroxy-2-oxoglutarate aldolase